jgi:gliding motility-associated-like protein
MKTKLTKLLSLLAVTLLLSESSIAQSNMQTSAPGECGGFRTQTQGGWGSIPDGGNPGTYLHTNFAAAFPSGLQVGCTNTLSLTTAQAVTDYLPSGTTPTALPTGALVNPGPSYNNVLAAQVVTLKLTLGFDMYDPNFSPATALLQDQTISSGTFQGWTVQQVLDEAERKLGGCSSSYGYSDLNEVITHINENFDDGHSSNDNFLLCCNNFYATINATPINCYGAHNGSATVVPHNGVAPYTYLWSNNATTATVNNLYPGNYTVCITDHYGCHASACVTITQPPALNLSISSSTSATCANSGGSATATVSGGNPPYAYSWNTNPVQTTATATNLGVGPVAVTVTDAHGCLAGTASVTITGPAALNASISAHTNVNCFGGHTASATVSVSGGTAPYSYSWNTSPIQTSATASGLGAGAYMVTVTDAHGCSTTASVNITQPSSALSANISAHTNVNCYGSSNGSATVSASGGVAPYTYSWNSSPVQTSNIASNLGAGNYIVTVTDANGCTANASVTITQPSSGLIATICHHDNITCYGGSNGTAELLAMGGTAPYTYSWNTVPVQTTMTASNLSAGTYIGTITDANGCTASATITLTQPSSGISATISSHTNISCFGNTNGSATVSVSGGTAPYSYSWNTVPAQLSASANNLGAGTYVVTVTDANGCTGSASVTITGPQAALSAAISAHTNISCFGNTNGSATVSVSGGTAPYTYSWNTSPVQTGSMATNLGAGNYNVTVTDAHGCTATASVSITQPSSALTASICNHVDVSCYGNTNGSAMLMISGGTAPYTYSWNTSPVQTTITASNLGAGTYIGTVTDANGCSASATVVITQPAASLSANISAQTNISCFGNNNGSATVSVSGGTAPYTYSWNTTPVQTTATINNLLAGNYAVTITDAHGCTATASVVISQPQAALSASISAQTNVNCFGGNNGSATVSVNGGTAPYSYSWNTTPVQTTATINNLLAGNYNVTITDAHGCTATASVIISQPQAALSANISAQTNVNCFGNTNGSATVSVSGGTAPYSYNWNTIPAQVSATATNLAAGNYNVTITDAHGCSATASVSITQPQTSLSASISVHTNISCYGNTNGSATVSVSGGTAPYTYSWNSSPVQTSATASNLGAGSYIVTVTDAHGCSATASVTLTQPAAAMSATISAHTNISCFGGNNGSATVSVSGGTAPYSYSWNTIPVQATATANNLLAGNYNVTVTDANGCSVTASVTISQPAAALSASISAQTNVSCNGNSNGSATVSVSGGTAPYSYSWNTSPVQTSAIANNLIAGSYIVNITDAHGCQATASVTISQPAAALSASISAQTNVSCFGNTNGSATVSASGGTSPYTYSWNTSPVQTSATATNLAAGNYNVIITDAHGCTANASVTISQPSAAMSATISAHTNISCFGNTNGSATVSVSGGTAPYTYSWNTIPVQTSAIASNLGAGSYNVIVTDAHGCSATASVTISQPSAALSANISAHTNVSCFGNTNGSATVSVSGGTAPYSYSWNTIPAQLTASATNLGAGNYMVTITDANGCTATASVIITGPSAALSASVSAHSNVACHGGNNGSATVSVSGGTSPYAYSWNTVPVQTSATASNLLAGNYQVIVTDANGCSANASVSITQPDSVLVGGICGHVDVSCNGGSNGSLLAMVSGGTGPFTYLWSPGGQTTALVSGLSAGNYSVTVTDAHGCTVTSTATITQPAALSANISAQTNISCSGGNSGSATVSVSGGTAPYSYSWNTSPVQTSATASNLAAGAYVVTVTDAHGCTATASVTITGPSVALSAIISAHTNVNCYGNTTGSATVTASGGTSPYAYSWNTMPVQTSATAINLGAGSYNVLVTDANGCSATASVNITQPDSMLVGGICGHVDVSCNGGSNGSLLAMVSGGTGPFTYLWSPGGQTTALVSGLSAGNYSVTVTDAHGCTVTSTATITQPASAITASISAQTNINCSGGNSGSATVSVSGGTAPYTYSWNTSPVQASATASNLSAGAYVVTITDAHGCTATASVTITGPSAALSATISAHTNVSCFGNSNGSATVTASGGTSPYAYSWNTVPVQTSATANNLAAGSYNVIVTDANGCSATASVAITQPDSMLVGGICGHVDVSCNGGSNGSLLAMVSGGTGPFTYLWSPGGQTTALVSGLSAGNYSVTVTDANGCSVTSTATITQPASGVTASISAQVNISCFGNNDGSATVSASGGTAPYTYSWSTTPVQTSATANNLAAGNYSVTVTDAHGCTATATVSIFQPAVALSATISSSFNVSCFGGNNGSATVMATGGTAPYTFSWNTTPVQTSASISNLAAGTYVVTVTDAHGCSANATVIIMQPSAGIAINISAQSDATCFGGSNGSASVAVSGGTAPYSYSWNTIPVQTSATASNLAAGTYIVTVTDANGCSANASVIISQPASALSASIVAQHNVTCFGNNDGSATVSVSGGTAPYSYSWNTSTVQTSATAINLSAGVYMVAVTDANGCSVIASVTISQPASAISATISAQSNVSCVGNNNGSATVSVSGGTAPYTYSWNTSPVQTSATANNLLAGHYVVTVTDSNGCSATASVTITQPQSGLSAVISAQHNVSCYGNSDGSATVSVSGGTAPYAYSWNTIPVQTSASVSNLAAGNYVVTITDANGCSISVAVNITQSASALSAGISAQSNVSCYAGANGSASVSVSGGTAPYSYSWNTMPVQHTATAINLGAGTYVVTVTDSNGCSATASVIISQPASALSASVSSQTNVSCYGDNNGSATISVSGGTAPYTYSWNTNPAQLTATANNLSAGTYQVFVIDANNCSVAVNVTISQPSAALVASISAQTNVGCFNTASGSATVSVSGGTGPYTYAWNTSPVQTGATASGLMAGNYNVTVTDANGCSATASVNISQPASSLSASVAFQADVLCFGDANGSANVTVSGGVAPYSYSWSTSPVQTSATATNLAAGSYTVMVTDSNNCSTSVIVTIHGPGAMLAATISSHTDISCNGNPGSATVSVSGGTGPYNYIWNTSPVQTGATASGLTAGNYMVTVTDHNGCTATASVTISQTNALIAINSSVSNYNNSNISCNGGNNGYINITVSGGTGPLTFDWSGPGNFSSSNQNISNLGAGVYELTVTDSAGCTASLTVNMTEPNEALALSSSITNVSCTGGNSGAIDLSVTGGTSPYSYAWTGPNNFSASTEDISGLGMGVYTVTVTDANGCTVSGTMNVAQPTPIVVSFQESDFNSTNISCHGGNDGSINMTVYGGSAPYSYFWNGPNGFTSGSEDISGLYAGNYTVTVTDANGCIVTMQDTLTEPSAITAIFTSMDANCTMHDGVIATDIFGGAGNYSCLWSNGNTSHDISGLSAGAYGVAITDGNGCTVYDTALVGSASHLEAEYIVTGGNCSGSNEGSIVLTVTNGTAPYTYLWATGETTNSLSGLAPGTYICTLGDSMGCVLVDSINVVAPDQLSINVDSHVYPSGHNLSAMNSHDGMIDLTVTGGTPPYTFQWSTGATSEDVSGLSAGTYGVIVTDANGCTTQAIITLTQPVELLIPTGFSPNGDGANDYFVVQGIENFPNNHIEIFNRWGNKVFSADNYTNKWQGVNENGDPLPDATYFVILEVNGGDMKLDSYVDLRR